MSDLELANEHARGLRRRAVRFCINMAHKMVGEAFILAVGKDELEISELLAQASRCLNQADQLFEEYRDGIE